MTDPWPGGDEHISAGDAIRALANAKKRIAELEALLREINEHDDVSFGPLTGDLRDRVRSAVIKSNL